MALHKLELDLRSFIDVAVTVLIAYVLYLWLTKEDAQPSIMKYSFLPLVEVQQMIWNYSNSHLFRHDYLEINLIGTLH